MAQAQGQKAVFAMNTGIVSQKLAGRADLVKLQSACRTLRNFIVLDHGSVRRRPGLQFVAEVKSD